MVSSLIKKIGNTLSLNKGTKISGQTVLITGGTSGMGLIMAKECAKRGASAIIIWDIARLDETVATLEGLGVKAGGYKVNVADVENVNAQAEQTLKDFGKVDILIQCAGVVSGKSLLELTDEQIDRSLDINLRGVFSVTRAFLGQMKGAKTKVPLLFPILDQYKVSMKILDAIEAGQPELFIPKLVQYATSLVRVLPTHWYDIVSTWLGINASMDDFVGRQSQKK